MCLFKFDKEKYENTLKRESEKKGSIETLISLVKKGLLTLQQAAEQLDMSTEKLEREAKNLDLL